MAETGKKKGAIIRDANDYDTTEPRFHVLHRPDMYLGSTVPEIRKVTLARVASQEEPKEGGSTPPQFIFDREAKIEMSEAVENIFREVFINASDAIAEGKSKGSRDNNITVTITKRKITIRNGGIGIPVEIHKKFKAEGYYVPYVVFGMMFSSSNYGEGMNTTEILENVNANKAIVGRNGIGSKLGNIFSKSFTAQVCDGKLIYTQTFRNNMSEFDPPIIVSADGHHPYVQVSYIIDSVRFKYAEYNDEALSLFRYHCISASCMNRMNIELNGFQIPVPNIYQFAKMEFPQTDEKKMIIGYDWEEGEKFKKQTTDQGPIQVATVWGNYPRLEYLLLVTPNKGTAVSFVNGNLTRDGGAHVDIIYKACKSILDSINENVADKKNKLNITYLKRHLSVVVNARVKGIPAFNNNTKTRLTKWEYKLQLDKGQLKALRDSELIQMLEMELQIHTVKVSAASGERVKINKLDHAHQAKLPRKKRDGKPCYLVLTEGDSALKFAKIFYGDDRDHYGTLPLRGKVINAKKVKSIEKLLKNEEYKAIKGSLGLIEGVDYSIAENLAMLKYDGVILAGDEDDDGGHIKGLIYSLFDTMWPELTENKKFLTALLETPLVSVEIPKKKGSIRHTFGSVQEYEDWILENPGYAKITPNYHKGLAAFDKDQIKKDKKAGNNRVVPIVRDSGAAEALDLGFKGGKDNIANRKEWIINDNPKRSFKVGNTIKASQLVREIVIRYAKASITRAFVSLDGHKESGRKLATVLLNSYYKGKFKEHMLTNVMAAKVIKSMHYNHGEQSLHKMIDGKTQDYPGSNNMPFLKAKALFGDRDGFGAGAARYTKTLPFEWWSKMFLKIDLDITPYVKVDGKTAEYEYIPQVLPYLLMNFSRGMGMGWSFFLPGCMPLKLADYFVQKLMAIESDPISGTEKKLPLIKPWARGFHGKIKLVMTSKLKEVDIADAVVDEEITVIPKAPKAAREEGEKSDSDSEEEFEGIPQGDDSAQYSMVVEGAWAVNADGVIIVSEILIGYSVLWYKNYYEQLVEDEIIDSCDDYCTDEKIEFRIRGMQRPSSKLLKLKTIIKLSNMYILDDRGIPIRYNSLNEIADAWFDWNYPHYILRKETMLKTMELELSNAKAKADLIKLVNDGKLIINRRGKAEVLADAKALGIETEYISTGLNLWSLTSEMEAKLRDHVVEVKERIQELTDTTPAQLWLKDIGELRPYL